MRNSCWKPGSPKPKYLPRHFGNPLEGTINDPNIKEEPIRTDLESMEAMILSAKMDELRAWQLAIHTYLTKKNRHHQKSSSYAKALSHSRVPSPAEIRDEQL